MRLDRTSEFKIDGLTKTYNKTDVNRAFPISVEFTFKGVVYDCRIYDNTIVTWQFIEPPKELKEALDNYLKQFTT